jgi:hypothetical protein
MSHCHCGLVVWHLRASCSSSSRQDLELKDRLGDQRGGEGMGADKKFSRRRLKLQQDQLARSDPQNRTLRTSTFCSPKPRSHWSANGPRNKHYQQPQLLRAHDSGNNSGAGCPEGSSYTGYGGRLDRLHQATKKSSETPLSSTKRTTVSPTEISGQGRASYQKTLAKTKTSPRGLGAVRPATRGGLTSCTQQRTPSKNS